MKSILLIVIMMVSITGCSKDNCSEEQKSINDYYDGQVKQVKDNPVGGQVDYRQIGLLEKDREKKLSEACN